MNVEWQSINTEGKRTEENTPTMRALCACPVAKSCLTLCAENISIQIIPFSKKFFVFRFVFGVVNKVRA